MFNKLMKLKYNFNPVLHNRIILYLFFAIALIDLMYFLNTNDIYSFSILILVGWLTSFFNKNMIVILFVSIILTHLLKYGRSSFSEGLEGMDKDMKNNKKVKESKDDIDAKTDEFSDKLNKINAIVKTKDEKSEKHSELIDGLKDMKDTRNKIVEHVQDMQPLLEKFQGYIEKFKEYKKLNENESLTNK